MSENNNFSNYKDKGFTGLANVGNTCYLNSCLQILSHTYEFSDFLKTDYEKKLKNQPESVALIEWDKLRKMMWSKNCTIAPYGFVKSIQKIARLKNRELFTGYEQNDMQEFLLFLIDCFHEGLSRPVNMTITGEIQNETDKLAVDCYEMMKKMYIKEYSEILNIFYGIHVSVVTCSKTKKQISTRPEPFSLLSLSIPNKDSVSLYDCIDHYCKKEILEKDNQYEKDDGEKIDASRGIIFWSLPNILIIDLKRWNPINGKKLHTEITAPLENLNLSKYVYGYDSKNYIYDLYGVCNHSGCTGGGHYIACVKNANGLWYSFNDTMIKQIDTTSIVSPNTYCFFYRKKKITH